MSFWSNPIQSTEQAISGLGKDISNIPNDVKSFVSNLKVSAPRLPNAPSEYNQDFMQQLVNVLRLYFNQLDNASPISLAFQNLGSTIGAGKPGALISALSFRQPVPHATPVTYQISLPTQTFTAYLRRGDVYYDTSANNVLKVIP